MKRNPSYHKIRKDKIDWLVVDEYSSLIPGELVDKVRNVVSSSDCRVIRENNVRISLFFTLPERNGVVFVKRYKCRGIMDVIKYFFFTSKASNEWKNMNRFLKKGIPVPSPLAKGEKRRFNCLLDSYLVTKAFVNAKPLGSFMEQYEGGENAPNSLKKKRKLIKELALLVKKIHAEGFFYRDLHAGNILVVEGNDGGHQLYPVDFHKIWYLRIVPVWMRIRDLAQLRNSFSVSRSDQLRFLREYAKQCVTFTNHFKVNALRIEAKAEKLWRVHLKSRTKRCLIESSEFAIKKDIKKSIYHHKGYSERLLSEIISKYHNALVAGKLTVLKKTAKEIVSVIAINHNGKTLKVLVKKSQFTSLLSRLRYLLYKPRARKYWVAARGLKVRGIETPLALALIENKHLCMPKENLLLIEFIDQSCELNDYVLKNFKKVLYPEEVHKKRKFIKELAERMKDLHEKGIYHADLKSNNILVKEKDEGGWAFYFVDLDRVAFKHHLSFRQRSNNLAQINASIDDCVSITDRLKFFRTYAWGTPVMKERKRYYQKILEIGRRKITEPYGLTFAPPANDRT